MADSDLPGRSRANKWTLARGRPGWTHRLHEAHRRPHRAAARALSHTTPARRSYDRRARPLRGGLRHLYLLRTFATITAQPWSWLADGIDAPLRNRPAGAQGPAGPAAPLAVTWKL